MKFKAALNFATCFVDDYFEKEVFLLDIFLLLHKYGMFL